MVLTKRILLHLKLHLTEKLPKGWRPVIRDIRCTSGKWNIYDPIEAYQTFDDEKDECWQATAKIPRRSEFEWRWTMYDQDDKPVDTELDYRRCQIGGFGGVMHTSWDNEIKILEPDMCVVTFHTRYWALPYERLAIIGSSDALGEWDSAKAAPAWEYPGGSGEWSAAVPLEKDLNQEWKWIVVDRYHNYIRRWEAGSNRTLNCESYCWKTIWAPWNGGAYETDHGNYKKMEMSSLWLPRFFDEQEKVLSNDYSLLGCQK